MGDRAQKEAWVTLATNDAYALGCLVLGNSLRKVNTTRQLAVMVTDGVSASMRSQLETVFNTMVDVGVLDSEDARNLSLLGRPDLNVTFTKIHCWELTQYEKAVFLDADTLVIQNCDELFDREELSAAPDAGWPDCFNSGVFVFRPSLETYQSLINFAGSTGSFDGGDQGLLNSYFNTWSTVDITKHLPFIYNVVSQAFYSYLPAFTQFRGSIKIVHFIGPIKPWHHPYNTATKTVSVLPETGHSYEFLQLWWDLFMQLVQPRLDPTLSWASMPCPMLCVQTPFIRYEYILPSSQPPPSLSSWHGMDEAHEGDPQPSSYQVLYPYVPPALDQQFYTPPHAQPSSQEGTTPHQGDCADALHSGHQQHEAPHHEAHVDHVATDSDHHHHHHHHQNQQQNEGGDGPQVVDMPIVSRHFHPYETHYAEEPLLLVDPDSPPPAIYESSQFEQILTEELKWEEEGAKEEGEVIGESGEDSIGATKDCECGADQSCLVNGANRCGVDTCSYVGKCADGAGMKGQGKQDVKCDEFKQSGTAGGLVGELAQIKLDGSGEAADYMVLDDRERRLAWERGHADYLGADSFENIQKKLDEKMAPTPTAKDAVKKSEDSLENQPDASLTKPPERRSEQEDFTGDKKSPKRHSVSRTEVEDPKSARQTSRQRSFSMGSLVQYGWKESRQLCEEEECRDDDDLNKEKELEGSDSVDGVLSEDDVPEMAQEKLVAENH